MKTLRAFGASAVAALAVLAAPGAPPASAAAPLVTISTPAEGATLSGGVPVAGLAEMPNNGELTRATVSFASLDGHTSENTTASYERGAPENPPVFSSSAPNNVRFSFTATPRHNGAYAITATATGRDPAPDLNGAETSDATVRRINVETPPLPPAGVSATIDGSKKVKVTWNANAEPDMVGYQVQRAYGGGSYREIGVVQAGTKPAFSDDLSDPNKFPAGQYRYRTIAIRRARTCANPSADPACNRGITSGPSAYDDVTVRATTTSSTTTTTTPRSTTTTRRGGDTSATTGGSSGTSGGSSTGSSANVPGGRVDLSDFSALLNGRGTITHIPDKQDDGTFGDLEYGEQQVDGSGETDPGTIEIGGRTIGPLKTSDDWVKFLGAGSLATALLVHLLWFKGQVDNFPLEAVAPGGD